MTDIINRDSALPRIHTLLLLGRRVSAHRPLNLLGGGVGRLSYNF